MTQSVITEHRPSRAAINRSSVAAALAGIAFAVEGAIAAVHTTGDSHWDGLSQALNVAFVIACLAVVVALPAVAAMIAPTRVCTVAAVGAAIGYAAMAVESTVSSIHGGNTLGPVFVLGLALSLLGLLALAVIGLINGALRWAAPLPLLGMLVGIGGGDHGGSILLGIVWLTLAALVSARRA